MFRFSFALYLSPSIDNAPAWDETAHLYDRFMRLQEQFGNIDIYLFDQILRGRIAPGMRIFDAGCGSGRNLVYFVREGFQVFGVDEEADAVESTRRLAQALAPTLPA